jgi:prolyl oligopeptidase
MTALPLAIARRVPRAFLAAGLVAAAAWAGAAPPAAPSRPVTDTLHGVAVVDPYRNLEDLKNPETRAWLQAQGDFAANELARIDGRDALALRIQALADATGDTVREVTRLPGDRVLYLKRGVGENQLKLVLRDGLAGPERVLVDPAALAQASGVPHAINYFAASWDGKRLAYGVSAGGSEDASLYLMEIATGRALGAPIPRVHEGLVRWAPDNRHLTYNQTRALPAGAPDTETFLDTTVFVIDAGRPESAARPLFGPLVETSLGLDRLDVAEVFFAPGSRWMIARTTDTTVPEGKLFVAPVAALGGAAPITWRPIATAADKITDAQLRGDMLYLRSYAGAPRGRVLALRLTDPVLARAALVVSEPEAGVLTAFALGRDAVYSEVRLGFNTRVRRHAGAAGAGQDIAPALSGSTFLVDDPARTHADPWVTTSTWTEPSRVLAVGRDGRTRDTGLRAAKRPPGMPELEVSEVLVNSHDGVRVPLAIVHRKGLALDGARPTLLIGYGAYGISMEARFDARSIAWLERGGVIAYANVRGSGAFGDGWHRAGFKATKPNTWKDGIACARYLVEQGYASPKTLGIWGTSAGGVFVGRAVTSAPQLFAAAIFDVGIMDTVRAEASANGITNISEFGTVEKPDEFAALLEMSTYAHIENGTAYPAVMLIHGLNDPRVDVWHSAKAAARLQAASSSGKPILLRTDSQAGHGVGSTAGQANSKLADVYGFLLWQFGAATQKAAAP